VERGVNTDKQASPPPFSVTNTLQVQPKHEYTVQKVTTHAQCVMDFYFPQCMIFYFLSS